MHTRLQFYPPTRVSCRVCSKHLAFLLYLQDQLPLWCVRCPQCIAWSGLCLFVRLTDTSIPLLLQLLWVHEIFCFLETDEQLRTDLVPIRILEKL